MTLLSKNQFIQEPKPNYEDFRELENGYNKFQFELLMKENGIEL